MKIFSNYRDNDGNKSNFPYYILAILVAGFFALFLNIIFKGLVFLVGFVIRYYIFILIGFLVILLIRKKTKKKKEVVY